MDSKYEDLKFLHKVVFDEIMRRLDHYEHLLYLIKDTRDDKKLGERVREYIEYIQNEK